MGKKMFPLGEQSGVKEGIGAIWLSILLIRALQIQFLVQKQWMLFLFSKWMEMFLLGILV